MGHPAPYFQLQPVLLRNPFSGSKQDLAAEAIFQALIWPREPPY